MTEERGRLEVAGGGEPVPLRFTRGRTSGRLWPEVVKDFAVLLEVFSGHETAWLVSRSGRWRAEVHVWEPDQIEKPRLARFRCTVQGVPTVTEP